MTVIERVLTYVQPLADSDDDLGGILTFCGIGLLLSLVATLVGWPLSPALMY